MTTTPSAGLVSKIEDCPGLEEEENDVFRTSGNIDDNNIDAHSNINNETMGSNGMDL